MGKLPLNNYKLCSDSDDSDHNDEHDALLSFRARKTDNSNPNCLWAMGVAVLIATLGITCMLIIISIAIGGKGQHDTQQPHPDTSTRQSPSKSPLMTFESNAVASPASVCNVIGSYVLNDLGGNAMDAAIATVLCCGGSQFQSNGIGGGSFMLYYDRAVKKFHAFNYREVAPKRSSAAMFPSVNASMFDGRAIAVPGEIAGLFRAHSKFGKLPWKLLVMPTVRLLRNGQTVTKAMAHGMQKIVPLIPHEPQFRELRRWIRNPKTGKVYREGEILIDKKLANTYYTIAYHPMSFYSGRLSKQIVQEIQDGDGIIEEADLLNFSVQELNSTELLSADLHNLNARLHFLPPPSGAIIIAFVLRILDGYQWKQNSGVTNLPLFLHRFVESLKFGFAQWSGLGDPNFVNVTELVHNLTDDGFIDEIRRKITDDRTHNVSYYDPKFHSNQDAGTTHVSVVDKDGNAVAVTSTINGLYGSLIRGPTTGIFYNNEMADFSLKNSTNADMFPPCPNNFISPGKRPLSSMSPMIITDSHGDVKVVTGAAGGPLIISSVAYTAARLLLLGENVKEAVDAARIHHQLVPDSIINNPDVDNLSQAIVHSLKKRGHKLLELKDYFSIVESIVRVKQQGNKFVLQSVGDFRKSSLPDGV